MGGGTKAIISAIGNADVVSPLVAALAPEGRLVLLGTGKDPLSLLPGQLVVGERGVFGSITGSPFENEKALRFSALADIRPKIETIPLENVAETIERLKSGDVKFRLVLTMR